MLGLEILFCCRRRELKMNQMRGMWVKLLPICCNGQVVTIRALNSDGSNPGANLKNELLSKVINLLRNITL